MEQAIDEASGVGGEAARRGAGRLPASHPRGAGTIQGQSESQLDADTRAAVDAVLGGDRDAFRLLVERESSGVVGACLRVLGDFHEAEDAAQEAFVTAFRSIATWRGDGPFGAWLARIAVRIALRRAAGRRTLSWTEPEYETAAPVGSGNGSSDVRDPMDRAVQGERDRAVRTAVAALEEPYREVVALRFFGDLSLAEIAAVTGRPIPTIKTHLRRGLIRLRDVGRLEGLRR